MNRSTNDAANQRACDDLDASFRFMYETNGWRARLAWYAERGYPSGGDNIGHGTGINRPTERAALAPLDECAKLLKQADEYARIIRDASRKLNSIRLVTEIVAPMSEPEPVPCKNLECTNVMDKRLKQYPRDGLCPRCATWKTRNGGLSFPHKHANTPAT